MTETVSKHETDQVFKVLKSQKGNKVRTPKREKLSVERHADISSDCGGGIRHASTVTPKTQHGPVSLMAYTSVSTVHPSIETWAFTSLSFGNVPPYLLKFTFLISILLYEMLVRSTNLDSWQLTQLRTMKVGGNSSATEFFTKHGGGSLLTDSDTKKKYTSRAAELYKEELGRRVKEDTARYPKGIHVDGMSNAAAAAEVGANDKEDDFFESWSKPSTPKPSSASSTPARVATPPVLGRAASSTSTTSTTTTAASTTSTTSSASRTITSSARSSRLGTKPSATTSSNSLGATKKAKLGGLGAQKTKPVDFAAAERKAKEEEERIRQLGYDREREEKEEKARKEAEEKRKATEIGKLPSTSAAKTNTTTATAKAGAAPKTNAAFPRLGFGAMPGAGAAVAVAATSETTTSRGPVSDDSPTTARDRFGTQKAISSDMYFGRNAYDPDAVNEAQTRLQSFQGATSISSNQYFGREEEEEQNMLDRDGGLLGDGSLSGLESAARDAMTRFLANPDVQNVQENIRSGALKLSDYLAQMSMDR
ncbi:hypothetical protein D9756_004544 [Leucocoprinus leucothites]|uniref:Arf-GAP domain-containing protein n=1 Tax=Leucocoprinus leucothites TaxID=201217 RepID=A0A8H5G8T7_9AGAR|nr:hypothetical protein D9756_004544 [Leucoagaricus leucothites]